MPSCLMEPMSTLTERHSSDHPRQDSSYAPISVRTSSHAAMASSVSPPRPRSAARVRRARPTVSRTLSVASSQKRAIGRDRTSKSPGPLDQDRPQASRTATTHPRLPASLGRRVIGEAVDHLGDDLYCLSVALQGSKTQRLAMERGNHLKTPPRIVRSTGEVVGLVVSHQCFLAQRPTPWRSHPLDAAASAP